MSVKKKFNGVTYTRATEGYDSKYKATKAANALRTAKSKTKYNARVVFENNRYWVYWRELSGYTR